MKTVLKNGFAFIALATATLSGIYSNCLVSSAAEKNSRIIDLGEVFQVQGELRKPMLQYIGSDRHLKGLLAETAKQEIKAFEASLLQFTTPETYKTKAQSGFGGQNP